MHVVWMNGWIDLYWLVIALVKLVMLSNSYARRAKKNLKNKIGIFEMLSNSYSFIL